MLFKSQEEYLSKLGDKPYMFAGCFAAGTDVWTPTGRKRIENLRNDSPIYSFDGSHLIASKVFNISKVANKPKPMIQFSYGEDTIRATYDHPFYDGERYYPLYQFVWRDMEASQRLQLQLLCEQYGEALDDTPSRGVSDSDTETWERPFWAPTDGDESKDSQSASGNRSNMDTQPHEPADSKSFELRPVGQQGRESGVGDAPTQQQTRLRERQTVKVARGSKESVAEDFYQRGAFSDMGYDLSENKYGNSRSIRRIAKDISECKEANTSKCEKLRVRLHSIQVLVAEPYYAITVEGDIKTYIVGDGLPVHNTGAGKTRMAMVRAKRAGFNKVIVITPATVRDTKQWEQEKEKVGIEFDEFQVEGYSFLQKFKHHDFTQYSDWFVIIDEAHKIKNSQSKQGQGAYRLCLLAGDYTFLSATPMSKWADAVNYAKITGLVKHKTEFYKRFVVEQQSYAHKGKDIVGYRDEETLTNWWNSIALRGRSEDFTELPRKQVIDVEIPVKRKGYVDMMKTRMRDGEPLDSAPKLNWALRAFAETAPEKIKWVVEKIEGLENCIVFVNTIAAMETLSEALTKAKIDHGVWYGAKKDKFEDQKVMLVQYMSGGTGLNLQKFNTTIFLSPCYSYTDYHQAMGRTWRTGATKRCVFYNLKAQNTIDGAIYSSLSAKKDFDTNLSSINFDDLV